MTRLITIAVLLACSIVDGQHDDHDIDLVPSDGWKEPTTHRSENGLLEVTLEVQEHNYPIGDEELPTFLYNGEMPGPTLVVHPGDRMKIHLLNSLTPRDRAAREKFNFFGDPRITNLHLHGMHVTPSGTGDVMSVAVGPGESFHYDLVVPEGHAIGTFWYHPHHHGSTAFQVSGGMAGAIIVADPSPKPNSAPMHLMMLQNLLLGLEHHDDDEHADTGTDTNSEHNGEHMEESHMKYMTHPSLAGALNEPLPDKDWGDFGSVFLVNGVYSPTLHVKQHQHTVLQFVNAAAASFLEIQTNSECTQTVIAIDGIPRVSGPLIINSIVLAPGNRVDVDIVCSTVGSFRVWSKPHTRNTDMVGSMSIRFHGPIMSIEVEPALVDAPVATVNVPPRPDYMRDLSSTPMYGAATFSMKLTHAKIAGMANGDMGSMMDTPRESDSSSMESVEAMEFWMNGIPFSGNVEHSIHVGTRQEWTISNHGHMMQHPFHVHVNHFQVISVTILGKEVDATKPPWNLYVGQYMDTAPVPPGGSVVVRFIPHRFTGTTMMHCHVLQHEDLGMMQAFALLEAEDRSQTFEARLELMGMTVLSLSQMKLLGIIGRLLHMDFQLKQLTDSEDSDAGSPIVVVDLVAKNLTKEEADTASEALDVFLDDNTLLSALKSSDQFSNLTGVGYAPKPSPSSDRYLDGLNTTTIAVVFIVVLVVVLLLAYFGLRLRRSHQYKIVSVEHIQMETFAELGEA